jgi:hypothetical protein
VFRPSYHWRQGGDHHAQLHTALEQRVALASLLTEKYCARQITLFMSAMNTRTAIALVAITIVVTVASYGYWHAATHATFNVNLAYKTEPNAVNRMRNGQIEFLDDGGGVLARASIDTKLGIVWLAHPDKGQCGPDLARDAYRECVEAQAAWIPQWVQAVRYANITLERCRLARRNVQLTTRRDNLWLWWLPLPRANGLPYTRYSATFAIDTKGCS